MGDTAIDEFIHLLQETRSAAADNGAAQQWVVDKLSEFLKEKAIPLWQATQAARQRDFRLGLVGLTNVGKSTLLQALLGHPVAPSGNRPMTSACIEYKYGSSWTLKCFQGLVAQPVEQFDTGQALGERIAQIATEGGSGRAADWVTATGPMQLLSSGLSVFDTPGLGSASATRSDVEEPSWRRVLDSQLHDVYFCVSAGAGDYSIGVREHEAYVQLQQQGVCGHLVVTKWTGSLEDRAAYQRQHAPLFPNCRFVFVNARRAAQGGDVGLDELKDIITSSASEVNRLRACHEELRTLWRDLEELSQSRKIRVPWPRAAKARFERALQLEE